MNIQDILRASHTMRWTIVNTAVPQSVAEHSFNVTMIARAIAKVLFVPDANITRIALQHDLDEVILGDIPSPAKKRGMRPPSLDAKNQHGSTQENAIVKAADWIEAYNFINTNGMGRHADKIKILTRKEMAKYVECNFSSDEVTLIWDDIIIPIETGDFLI